MKKISITGIFMATAVIAASGFVQAKNAVTILYTNDIHSYINNQTKDENDNPVPLLRYSSIAALRSELESEGKQVLLVDAGDHSQGAAYGSLDEGKSVISIMNAVGYQLATLGNHEFDYGMFRAFAIMDEADFPYVSCSFYSTETGEPVLPSYEILEAGDVKIGFVGISTPDTIKKSPPSYYMDESGEKYLYNFVSGDDGSELYEAVQKAIDEVKDQVDYVIALGHLGVDTSSLPYRSTDVIANTTGLDAFIDGHSHTVMEKEIVTDLNGNEVLLTQTGCYLGSIGEMTIEEDGTISTVLVTEYDGVDEEVQALEDEWIAKVDDTLGEKIAILDSPLYIMNPEDPNERLCRRQETNAGDITADSVYYYFNIATDYGCDVVVLNGGGLRSDAAAGDVSYLTAKSINPFGNVICMTETTGQKILDALEKGAAMIGCIDGATGKPAEGNGFLSVAGLRYEIDTTIESTVRLDENGIWTGSPTGSYKVQNVRVYNRETDAYEPLDVEKTYRIAGANYLLRNAGSGLTMFKDDPVVIDYVGEDYMILADYFKAFAKGEDGVPHISSANSPLAVYKHYLLDYESPSGNGRIIVK